MPEVGDVCWVFLHDDAPRKLAICIDAGDCYYVLINRRRYNSTTDLRVTPEEIGTLTVESYIETADLEVIWPDDVLEIRENIGYELRLRICLAVKEHGALAPVFMRPLLRNLCDIDLDAD